MNACRPRPRRSSCAGPRQQVGLVQGGLILAVPPEEPRATYLIDGWATLVIPLRFVLPNDRELLTVRGLRTRPAASSSAF